MGRLTEGVELLIKKAKSLPGQNRPMSILFNQYSFVFDHELLEFLDDCLLSSGKKRTFGQWCDGWEGSDTDGLGRPIAGSDRYVTADRADEMPTPLMLTAMLRSFRSYAIRLENDPERMMAWDAFQAEIRNAYNRRASNEA